MSNECPYCDFYCREIKKLDHKVETLEHLIKSYIDSSNKLEQENQKLKYALSAVFEIALAYKAAMTGSIDYVAASELRQSLEKHKELIETLNKEK
jgi:regulator of replication initiation timing